MSIWFVSAACGCDATHGSDAVQPVTLSMFVMDICAKYAPLMVSVHGACACSGTTLPTSAAPDVVPALTVDPFTARPWYVDDDDRSVHPVGHDDAKYASSPIDGVTSAAQANVTSPVPLPSLRRGSPARPQ